MPTIWVRVKLPPAGLEGRMKMRKPGPVRRYWTEIPEPVDADDKRVKQLLHSGDLIAVDPPPEALTPVSVVTSATEEDY